MSTQPPIRVEFASEGSRLVGRLFLPAHHRPGQRHAAVVVAGTWTSVKEQMALRHAERMAAKGFVALAFDYRNYGESEGEPRQFESAKLKVEDIRAAVAFLQGREEVDPARVGALGICASAGYMALAVADGVPVASFAVVASWLHDPQTIALAYGGAEEVTRRLALAEAARRCFEEKGEVEYVPAQSPIDSTAAMPFPLDFYQNPERGNLPEWTNRFAVMAWREWLTLDMISPAARIAVPTVVVHSDKAAFPDNVRRFFDKLQGPKRLVWTGGEQTDFYDQDAQVSIATDAVAAHFAQTLMSEAERQAIRDQSLQATREFFAALEARDVDRFLEVWDDEGVQDMPYAPDGFPKRLEGKEAIRNQYAPLPGAFEWMRFPVSLLTGTEDPNVVVAEFAGDIKVKATGGKYDNAYVGVFRYEGGKLKRYSEYFDPNLLARAFSFGSSEEEIRKVVDAVGEKADARDWAALQALFTDRVWVDYTSLTGGEPAEMAADDLIAGWKVGLGRFARTRHLMAKHQIEAGEVEAVCRAEVVATHEKDTAGTDRWTCGGRYQYRLRRTESGWKVAGTTFTLDWDQGER